MKPTRDNPQKTGTAFVKRRNLLIEGLAATQLFFATCFLLAALDFANPSWRRIFVLPIREPELVAFVLAWASLFLLASGLLFVSAVGLYIRKQWARSLTLLLAWLFLVFGLLLLPLSLCLDVDEIFPVILAPYMPSLAIVCLVDSLLCIVASGIGLIILLPDRTRALFR